MVVVVVVQYDDDMKERNDRWWKSRKICGERCSVYEFEGILPLFAAHRDIVLAANKARRWIAIATTKLATSIQQAR